MLVAGPQRGLFLACVAVGVGSLVALDLGFGPAAIRPDRGGSAMTAGSGVGELVEPATSITIGHQQPAEPTAVTSIEPRAEPPRVALAAAARVPTIVARFDSEAQEPSDLSGVRALATAMIEDHDVTVVLEGHSDTFGGEDFNHTISLRRAEWVKNKLIALGVTADRIEAVGLGATRPLRSDLPDAQAVNRRVEVRWIGR